MKDFAFKVNLVAVVRVRADDESMARKVVPSVVGAPGPADIRLTNENIAAMAVTNSDRCRFLYRIGQAPEGWFEVRKWEDSTHGLGHLNRAHVACCLYRALPPIPGRSPASGDAWLHEIKHDGFRVIARKDGERLRLYSRPGNDLTYRFG